MFRPNIFGKGQAIHGDKTITGAVCIASGRKHNVLGRVVLCKGDKTSVCPACGQQGQIATGLKNFIIDGKEAAVHGSKVACGCPPGTNYIYAPVGQWLGHPDKDPRKKPKQLLSEELQRGTVDPGFCIAHVPTTVSDYGNWLLANAPEGTRDIYDSLNGQGIVKSGAILLVVDPQEQDPKKIELLQDAKKRVDRALEPLSDEEANFLHRHYATIANFTKYADKGIGFAGDSVKTYFEQIEKTLEKIQELHQETFKAHGTLANEIFYSERRRLFKDLDRILLKFIKKDLGLKDYADMKKALNLSTKSIVHKWDKVGIRDIEGYSTYIENAAKYVKWMKTAGYLSIGFSALNSANEIHEACVTGRENECTKTKYKEIGKFAIGLKMAMAGGEAGFGLCSSILGPETLGLGILVCGIGFGAIGGYVGGEIGSEIGDKSGQLIYKVVTNND